MDLLPQTYSQLEKELNLKYELPISPNWSAAADFLFLIKEYCISSKPRTIVECSSGLTTLVLAACCKENKQGRVYSLENGEDYVSKTQQSLQQQELNDYAEVLHAPLQNITLNNQVYQWYGINDLMHSSIDMLVIDGPPGFIQKHSRFAALPILFEQLAEQSVVYLDDAAREDEKEIVSMWLGMYPGIKHEYIETERGCSVLIIKK